MSLTPIQLIANQTNITPTKYFFLQADVSSLNVNNISTGGLTAQTILTSSLLANYISSSDVEVSSLFATVVDLDGQVLTASPTELLLNGIPLATTSNLSSIGDWALEPAVSTVQMNGNNLIEANNISSVSIQATNAVFQNLIAVNTMFVSSHISSISSSQTYTDEAFISSLSCGTATVGSLSANSISTPQILNLSSLNGQPIAFYEPGGVSTVSSFIDLNVSSLSVSSINGQTYISGSNWANYPALVNVNMNGKVLDSVPEIHNNGNILIYSGNDNVTVSTPSGVINLNAESINMTADEGANVLTNATIDLTAKNGLQGEINIIADTGYADIGGVVNVTANGGVTPLGIAYGGEVNITATTGGSFTTLSLTSAINLSASGINSYAGATSPIGSLTGFNFVHGDAGVNITAGLPPIFSDPLCVYLRGTNGILVDSTSYMRTIRPYSDLVQNPVDLYIEDYSNLITHGYVQLRGVSTMTFAGGDTAIIGVNKVQFSSIGGEVNGVSSINGIPIDAYQNISSISSLNEWALYPALSTIDANNNDIINVNRISSISSATVSSLSVNSANFNRIGNFNIMEGSLAIINGLSTFEMTCVREAIFQSTVIADTVSTSFLYGANSNLFNLGLQGLEIDCANLFLSTPNVVHPGFFNGSTIAVNYEQARIASISSATISSINDRVPALQDDANSFSSITTSTLFTPNIVADRAFFSTQVTGNVVGSDYLTNTISSFSSIQASGAMFNRLNTNHASVSSLAFSQTGAFGLSSLMFISTTSVPGSGTSNTSTCVYLNTDFSVGQADLFAQQLILGAGNVGLQSTSSEIIMYQPDGGRKTLNVNNGDRTIRVQTSGTSFTPGYILDTFTNRPFFSTINQSTSMMSFFPSSAVSTIGVSTISFIPPKNIVGGFASLSTQNIIANTPLVLWQEATPSPATGGITTSTTTIVIPQTGNYEVNTSIQFSKTGGSGLCDFWFRVNGTDLANSGSQVYLPNAGNGETLGNVSLITTFNAGDKLEVVCASPDTGVSATFFQSTVGTPYTRPAIPSVITSVKSLNY